MKDNEKVAQIALSLIEGIGTAKTERLIDEYKLASVILKQDAKSIASALDCDLTVASDLVFQFNSVLTTAKEEYEYSQKKGIKIIFFTDKEYPLRMRDCPGYPILFYLSGEADFNDKKYVSIVGTRRATEHGKKLCNKFVEDLAAYSKNIVIISGLAYGIDITAHKAALASGLKTYGIIAGGFNNFYPSEHVGTARQMVKTGGGVITELTRDWQPLPEFFAKRNRIIAALSDATIVVESAINGGSLITAKQALSYGRDLFAFPGRVGERLSGGCNNFIKYNKAGLIENADDFLYFMNWSDNGTGRGKDIAMDYKNLNEEEKMIYQIIEKEKTIHLDTLELYVGRSINLSSTLLNMELNDVIERLPGNFYTLA